MTGLTAALGKVHTKASIHCNARPWLLTRAQPSFGHSQLDLGCKESATQQLADRAPIKEIRSPGIEPGTI